MIIKNNNEKLLKIIDDNILLPFFEKKITNNKTIKQKWNNQKFESII